MTITTSHSRPLPDARLVLSFETLLAAAERYYATHGYVKWADIAREFNLSRQAVHARFQGAVSRGLLSAERMEQFQTVTSRRKAAEDAAKLRKLRSFTITLSSDNAKWLSKEAQRRRLRRTDILDGLISQARSSHASPTDPA